MESRGTDDILVVALNRGCGIWVTGRTRPVWLEGTAVDHDFDECWLPCQFFSSFNVAFTVPAWD